jgi:glycosyltransferase involved in cell wall biosynthesis
LKIAHITSVHPRKDIRIYHKECLSLAGFNLGPVSLYVADGLGDEVSHQVSIRDVGKPRGGRFGRALMGNIQMVRAVLRDRQESIHFHDPELLLGGIFLRLFRRKVIYDVHENVPKGLMSKRWVPTFLRWPAAKIMSILEWFAGRVLSAIAPATPTIARRFPAKKTFLIQNFPIQSEMIQCTSSPYASRPLAFAYVGAVSEGRGIKESIRALEYLQDMPELRLEIAGGFSPDSFEDQLKNIPYWRHVNYHGFLTRSGLSSLLGKVRAGLVLIHPLPNYIDAQPNKMFEYMSAGLPVIASDFPLWRPIIEKGRCGILVDPFDCKAIAQAMRWILEHPLEAEEMGKRGRKIIEESYNWEIESKSLLTLYKTLHQP